MKSFILITIAILSIQFCQAHSGRTDSDGGHWNRKAGTYHWHHGQSAHQHHNGKCSMYSFAKKNIKKDKHTFSTHTILASGGATTVLLIWLYKRIS